MLSETMPYEKKFAACQAASISPMLRKADGDPIVLLHGNPTSSFPVA